MDRERDGQTDSQSSSKRVRERREDVSEWPSVIQRSIHPSISQISGGDQKDRQWVELVVVLLAQNQVLIRGYPLISKRRGSVHDNIITILHCSLVRSNPVPVLSCRHPRGGCGCDSRPKEGGGAGDLIILRLMMTQMGGMCCPISD